MNSQVKRITIAGGIFFSLLAVAFFIYLKMPVFADSLNANGELKDSYFLNLVSNGRKTRFELRSSEKNAKDKIFKLYQYDRLGRARSIELLGFENYVSLNNQFSLSGYDYLIFTGDVGAHSQNLFAVKVSADKMKGIVFNKDNEKTETLTSDLPLFKFNLTSSTIDIETFNRDYEKDPIQNFIIDSYSLVGETFNYIQSRPGVADDINRPASSVGGIK